MKSSVISFFLYASLFYACQNSTSKNHARSAQDFSDTLDAEIVTGNFSANSPFTIDSLLVESFFEQFPKLSPYHFQVMEFYRKRNYALAWHDSLGKIEVAQLVMNRVMQMEENGLSAEVPYLEDYKRLSSKLMNDSVDFTDMMQTAQYFHFAERVLGGVSEKEVYLLDWHIPKAKKNYIDLLEKMIGGDVEALDKSIFPQYNLLKKQLLKLRRIQQNGGWPLVNTDKQKLKKGDKNELLRVIKTRLRISGELEHNDTTSYFTKELDEAVRLFQENHGIPSDGELGKLTLHQMNIPVEDRIRQVMINMERCRWLPNETIGDYLMVNIPSYDLLVMNGDSLVFNCEAIVGKETNRTTIFIGMMKYIVFNPYWNIPNTILEKEILPALTSKTDYLKRNHMEWYDGRLRQLPGEDNALGVIKFVFPNPFDIYLHDTPSKGLFKEKKRAFSHGCIRISAPHQLAVYLLREQKDWGIEKIDRVIAQGKEHYVKLEREVPVYILYLTTFVDVQGNLNFREDIYQKDPALMRMLFKN